MRTACLENHFISCFRSSCLQAHGPRTAEDEAERLGGGIPEGNRSAPTPGWKEHKAHEGQHPRTLSGQSSFGASLSMNLIRQRQPTTMARTRRSAPPRLPQPGSVALRPGFTQALGRRAHRAASVLADTSVPERCCCGAFREDITRSDEPVTMTTSPKPGVPVFLAPCAVTQLRVLIALRSSTRPRVLQRGRVSLGRLRPSAREGHGGAGSFSLVPACLRGGVESALRPCRAGRRVPPFWGSRHSAPGGWISVRFPR